MYDRPAAEKQEIRLSMPETLIADLDRFAYKHNMSREELIETACERILEWTSHLDRED